MINLAFLCFNVDESGGLERVISSVANGLSDSGNYNIYIYSLYGFNSTFFKFQDNIEIIYLNSNGILNQIFKLRKELKNKKIKKLITVDTLLSLISIPATVGTLIDNIGWEHYSFYTSLLNKRRKLARFLAIKFFNKIVVLTHRDAINWQNKYKVKSKIEVIINPTSFEIDDFIDKSNSHFVLAVGRLRYEKGFDILIEAWHKAIKFLPKNLKLIIVGEGENKKQLELLIKKYSLSESVEIKNFTQNIENYYRGAKLYCLTSRTEALPLVLIEALCFSTPLLAMDCYTGPKEIIVDGYNGFLCPENNIDFFVENLVSLLNLNEQAYSKFSQNAFLSSKQYNLSQIISMWIEILEVN